MTSTENTQQETKTEKEPHFNIQKLYLKDCSIEQPNSPAVFINQTSPEIDIQLDISVTRLEEIVFEVVVKSVLTIKQQEKVALLIELHQAGIFDIDIADAVQLDQVIGIACPTIIYPYLRSNMADLIARAGFAPVHLSEINFQALYEQRINSLRNEQVAAEESEKNIDSTSSDMQKA